MRFEEVLPFLKEGKKIRRSVMLEGVFIVLQKGYPDGIPCNKQTADIWGMKEGDLFKCNPYLQIRTYDGSHAMWVLTTEMILASDWEVL